jgi:hypothetical protein
MAGPRPDDTRATDRPAHLRALPSPEVDTSDWPAQAADAIERVVQGVRDKTTGPAITAARWLVAGVFLLFAGTALLILLVIALVRVLDVYLPDDVFGEQHVWAAHGILGLPLFLAGLFLLSRRNRHEPDAP